MPKQLPSLNQLLEQLNHQQTQLLLQNLVTEQPELLEAIARHTHQILSQTAPTQPSKPTRQIAVDPDPIRRRVAFILENAAGYWDDAPALDQIRDVMQQAQDFTNQGDGNNALVVLEAMTDAYVADWMNLDGSSGESGMIFEEFDAAWTEAILSAELTPTEREDIQALLEKWQDEVDEYGIDNGFEMGLAAGEQGWEYPPLQRVLEGHITEQGAWDGEPPHYADELARIRLDILERQGRYQEYLYLAEAEGQTARYLTGLARLGRVSEAVAQAQTLLTTVDQALALAQALQEQGALEQALHIAQAGLQLTGYHKHELAIWTSELAERMDRQELALEARVAAFQASPSFTDYLKVQELADEERWSTLRPDLLASLSQSDSFFSADAKVDIFLHENLSDQAIAAVDNLSSYQSEPIHRVMNAAIAQHPDWVIANACRRAESIMDQGKAKYYHHAIEWLSKARAAYLQSGRKEEWQAYRAKIRQKHGRKYKLMGMLKQPDLE
ncbi:MAG: SWIM zinc finger domain-containing protein [Xenococcaceae cyanobacterium]